MDDRSEELTIEECLELLGTMSLGRVAINDDRGPLVFPVNYALVEGAIVFRSDLGTKVVAAEDRRNASFEVDHVDERAGSAWSVLVRGRLAEVAERSRLDEFEQLGLVPLARGPKLHFVELSPSGITGRRISIAGPLPEAGSTATA